METVDFLDGFASGFCLDFGFILFGREPDVLDDKWDGARRDLELK